MPDRQFHRGATTSYVSVLSFLAILIVPVLAAGCAEPNPTVTPEPNPTITPESAPTVTQEPTLTAAPEPTPEPTITPTSQPAQPSQAVLGDPIFPRAGNDGYDAQHYLLDIAVDVERNVLTATVTMTAEATQELSAFNLDFAGLTIDSVAVNDQTAAYERDGQELTVHPSQEVTAGAPFTTEVSYHGTPGRDAWHHQADAIYVAAEPVGAATWFPVNNHPLDKATYTFRITARKPYRAVSNGTLLDVREGEDDVTYVWEMDTPMASYLSMLYVADLAVHDEEDQDDVSIQNYLLPGLVEEAGELFDTQDEMMAFFTSLFGPYPFETYGAAVVDDEWPGAVETQTLPLFGRGLLLRDTPPDFELPPESTPQTAIAHELVHQWFGNSVSLESWQDLWLKSRNVRATGVPGPHRTSAL